MNPALVASVFRVVALAEALSWIGLLTGIYVKRVLGTSEVGVQRTGRLSLRPAEAAAASAR